MKKNRYYKNMKASKLLLGCAFATLLIGCGNYTLGSSNLTTGDLVGTYKDNNPLAASTLVLKTDGTAFQTLITQEGKKYTATGKWTFNSSQSRIDIDNALSYGDLLSSGKPQLERIGMSCLVEKIIPTGQPQLVVDQDQGIAFNKTE